MNPAYQSNEFSTPKKSSKKIRPKKDKRSKIDIKTVKSIQRIRKVNAIDLDNSDGKSTQNIYELQVLVEENMQALRQNKKEGNYNIWYNQFSKQIYKAIFVNQIS
jgi:hypothetical protein